MTLQFKVYTLKKITEMCIRALKYKFHKGIVHNSQKV